MEAHLLIVGFAILTICFVQLFLIVAYIKMAVERWGENEEEKPKKKRKQKKEQATNDHGAKVEKRNTHKRSC